MCSEYQTKITPKEIEEALGAPVIDHTKGFKWGSTVKMFTEAPVIESRSGELHLVMKTFPKSPFPNARMSGLGNQSDAASDSKAMDTDIDISRIYEKSLWRKGFESFPVLVPMSSFTEFAYWGPEKGAALKFSLPEDNVLFAAGIGIKPYAPEGNFGDAFAIVTHTATPQMLKYHQRFIELLRPPFALPYLNQLKVTERFNHLVEHRYTGDLEVEVARKMAKGWESRIERQEAKLSHEERYRSALKDFGVKA